MKFCRGQLTQEIQDKYPFLSLKELRLIPYFLNCCVNSRPIDIDKIDGEELDILILWQNVGRIIFSFDGPCSCTREFYDMMTDIMFMSYIPKMEDLKTANERN